MVIELGEKTKNNGHQAVQGHSRSPILVPMERLYATCNVRILTTTFSMDHSITLYIMCMWQVKY